MTEVEYREEPCAISNNFLFPFLFIYFFLRRKKQVCTLMIEWPHVKLSYVNIC